MDTGTSVLPETTPKYNRIVRLLLAILNTNHPKPRFNGESGRLYIIIRLRGISHSVILPCLTLKILRALPTYHFLNC